MTTWLTTLLAPGSRPCWLLRKNSEGTPRYLMTEQHPGPVSEWGRLDFFGVISVRLRIFAHLCSSVDVFQSFSSVKVAFLLRRMVEDTVFCWRKGCAQASLCPPRFDETLHSRQLDCDARTPRRHFLCSRGRGRSPRAARRSREKLVDRKLRGGRPALGRHRAWPARGPGPTGAPFSDRRYQIHISGMASPPRSAFETT